MAEDAGEEGYSTMYVELNQEAIIIYARQVRHPSPSLTDLLEAPSLSHERQCHAWYYIGASLEDI